MLEYWKPVTAENGYVYSCDMVRYKLEIKEARFSDSGLQRLLTAWGRMDVQQYPVCFSDFKYRNLFRISYGESGMTAGIGFNGCKNSDNLIGFFEVNPNKCFGALQCLSDIQNLLNECWEFELLRFDLAIDIPADRSMLSLVKDGRSYMLDMRSASSKTEYLGTRNASGYVKLYNKSAERGTDADGSDPLSRLEMTCAGSLSAEQIIAKLPYVYTASPHQTPEDESSLRHLSSTQRTLVRALRSHPDRDELYKSLNADMRVKLRPYIYAGDMTLAYSPAAVDRVLQNLRGFEEDMWNRAYIFTPEELEADRVRRTAERKNGGFVPVPDQENVFMER